MDYRSRGRRTRRWLAVAVAGALLATAGAAASPATAVTADAAPVVFILDASGSMVREAAPGKTRMDVAKQATIDTIESLSSGTDVGLLVFGTGTGNDESERAAGCEDVKTLAPLAAVDVDTLSTALNRVEASGFTPIGPALRQAVSMLPAGEAGSIVLISDGVDTCSPPSSCEVASQLHRDNPLISIHVVAFGVDDDEAAQQQMTCIAGVGGGTSVSASDAAQLTSRLRAASDTAGTSLGIRGARGIELGMTLDEVRARVDGAKVGETEVVGGIEIVYVDCGWGTVELRNNRVWAIAPSGDDVGTADGIVPGAALSAVEALYGAPVDSGTTVDGLSNVYQLSPGSAVGFRVFYDPASEKITRIVLCRCVPASAISTWPADWEVSFEGVGPLLLGMSVDEARAAVPALVDSGYPSGGWVVHGNDGVEQITAIFIEDRLASVRIGQLWSETQNGAVLPHARGIRLGDTGATARNAFPGGSYFSVLVAATSEYLVSDREGHVLIFGIPGSSGYGGGVEAVVDTSPIGQITVEDAALLRTDAAMESLYGVW